MNWLRTKWVWLVATVAGLAAFFFVWRRDSKTPVFDGVEDKRKKIEEDTGHLSIMSHAKHKVAQERIERDRLAKLSREKDKIRANTETVEWDPEEVNAYVSDVDEEMRDGQKN